MAGPAVTRFPEFPRSVSADEFRAFMHQPAHQVSAYLRECGQRRWANPPLEVLFADGLSAEEADALMSADGVGMPPKLSDQFHSALSDEYYDVFSDAYYDSHAPCASLAPYGVFREVRNHVTVTVTVWTDAFCVCHARCVASCGL
jgi:hypothetical protein